MSIERKSGAVTFIGDAEYVSGKFSKRIVVIDASEIGQDGQRYDNIFPCEFTNNRMSLLDSIVVGQMVTISYTLQGKEHNGRYYLSARGINIQPEVAQQQNYPSQMCQRPQGGYSQYPQGYQQGPQGYPQQPQGYHQQSPQQAPFPGYPTYPPYNGAAPGEQAAPWQH